MTGLQYWRLIPAIAGLAFLGAFAQPAAAQSYGCGPSSGYGGFYGTGSTSSGCYCSCMTTTPSNTYYPYYPWTSPSSSSSYPQNAYNYSYYPWSAYRNYYPNWSNSSNMRYAWNSSNYYLQSYYNTSPYRYSWASYYNYLSSYYYPWGSSYPWNLYNYDYRPEAGCYYGYAAYSC